MRILNSFVVKQVSNCQSWVSAISGAYFLCSTAIRSAWCFRNCDLPCRGVECVLLHSRVNAQL